MSVPSSSLSELSEEELSTLLTATVSELARRGTPTSFRALIEASAHVGASLGESARQVAATTSWAQVGDLSGTTRQAAWSRWS
jgi:hypothetical protein